MKIFAARFRPDQDLKQSLKALVSNHNLQAGFILTAVGSLRQASLRLAGQDTPQLFQEKLEIISLVGTLSTDGMHLHIGLANRTGKTIGGHLLDGCLIYTTAEVVIGESPNHTFSRTFDPQTGFKEFKVQNSNNCEL